jgi:hypothetical protein
MMAILGALLPRFLLLVGWVNDAEYWANLFGATLWSVAGFLFLPWTMLVYGIAQTNGMTLLNWIFVAIAFAIDLGTWGVGVFAARKQTSVYRGA